MPPLRPNTLKASSNTSTHRLLRYFDGEVPYRFLSPWFPAAKGDKKQIYSLSQSFLNDSLYAVNEHEVTINPKWIAYLSQNSGILKSFCYWHLSLYLQKHNPNVPDIPNKLIKPPQRNGLSKQRKDFWDLVIHHNGPVNCIYTFIYGLGSVAYESYLKTIGSGAVTVCGPTVTEIV